MPNDTANAVPEEAEKPSEEKEEIKTEEGKEEEKGLAPEKVQKSTAKGILNKLKGKLKSGAGSVRTGLSSVGGHLKKHWKKYLFPAVGGYYAAKYGYKAGRTGAGLAGGSSTTFKLLLLSLFFWILPIGLGNVVRSAGLYILFTGALAIIYYRLARKLCREEWGSAFIFFRAGAIVYFFQNILFNTYGVPILSNIQDMLRSTPSLTIILSGRVPLFNGLILATFFTWLSDSISNEGGFLSRNVTRIIMVGMLLMFVLGIPAILLGIDSTTEAIEGLRGGVDSAISQTEIKYTINVFKATWDAVKAFFGGVWESFGSIFVNIKKSVGLASQDYYAGRVEQGQREKLGVYLENIKPADELFLKDEKVSVYGTLSARTLDDSVDISIACYAGDASREDADVNDFIKGISRPEEGIRVFNLEEEDIDCEFEPYTFIRGGTYPISFVADFNFETMAFLKKYFIEEGNLRSLQRENTDPFILYDIEDINPVAMYTNGPVMIGIGPEQSLIDIKNGSTFRLGVTLENNRRWNGKIKEVDQLIIQVPEGINIEQETCSHSFSAYTLEECTEDYLNYESKQFTECMIEEGFDIYEDIEQAKDSVSVRQCLEKICNEELEGYNAYNLRISDDVFEDIETFKTFSCRARIDDLNQVMQNSPIITHYLRAKARYQYSLAEKIAVRIKQDEFDTVRTSEEINELRAIRDNAAFVQAIENQYKTAIEDSSEEFGIDKCIIISIIGQELKDNPSPIVGTRNPRIGLMKIKSDDAVERAREIKEREDFETNYINPAENIRLGAAQLKHILDSASDDSKITNDELGEISLEDLFAAYREEIDVLKGSSLCENTRKWRCSQEPLVNLRTNYVPNAMVFYNECKGVSASTTPDISTSSGTQETATAEAEI